MINPYQPPKALVADVAAEPGLPLAVRILRACAIAGDVLLGALPPLVFAAVARVDLDAFFAAFSAGAYLVAGSSIAALLSRPALR